LYTRVEYKVKKLRITTQTTTEVNNDTEKSTCQTAADTAQITVFVQT